MLLAVTIVPRLPGVTIEMKSGTASALRSFGFRLVESPVAGRKEITFRQDLSDTSHDTKWWMLPTLTVFLPSRC